MQDSTLLADITLEIKTTDQPEDTISIWDYLTPETESEDFTSHKKLVVDSVSVIIDPPDKHFSPNASSGNQTGALSSQQSITSDSEVSILTLSERAQSSGKESSVADQAPGVAAEPLEIARSQSQHNPSESFSISSSAIDQSCEILSRKVEVSSTKNNQADDKVPRYVSVRGINLDQPILTREDSYELIFDSSSPTVGFQRDNDVNICPESILDFDPLPNTSTGINITSMSDELTPSKLKIGEDDGYVYHEHVTSHELLCEVVT